jgi:choline dehydrogenase
VIQDCTQPVTAYAVTKGIKQLMVGIQYLLTKEGYGRQQMLESGGFSKSREGLDRPDLQFHFVNAQMQDHARISPTRDGFTMHICQLRPESRGTVTLASSNPFAAPCIDPNYLATEEDRRALREGVKQARAIFAQAALDPFRGAEFKPGAEVQTDDEIDAYVRATAETIYHPVGTCRMGVDPGAVVDGECQVRGVKGLRVVDASVMPTLIGGNTNAPTIMIAEKIADVILGKPALAPEEVEIV